MKIVTGYTGTPHISSNDDQARNQGIFGTGNYVLNVGNKLNATLTNATTVTLSDGDGVIQGVHFRIEPGMTEAVSISPGTTGYNRIDLICARYTKEVSTGIEDVSLVVIEGTPTTGIASEPSYTEGNILAGDTLAEFPMWKVTLTGLTPVLTRAFNYSETVEQISSKISVYSGVISNIPGQGRKSVDIPLGSNNFIVLGVMSSTSGTMWVTPYVDLESDADPTITIQAMIYQNALTVTIYNGASGAADQYYRVAIMKLAS